MALVSSSAFLLLYNQDQGPQDKLIGVWIPDEDGYDNRWVFKEDGTIDKYDEDQVWITYDYKIEGNPSCVVPVTVEPGLYYVKMIEKPGPLEQVSDPLELCYELDGVDDDCLSLIYVEGASYRPTTFKRFVPQQGD